MKKSNTFVKQNHDILLGQGKQMVDEEFRSQRITNYDLDNEFALKFQKNNISSLDDMYLEVAKNNLSAKTVVSKYIGASDPSKLTEEALSRQIERSQRILTTNSETGVVVEGLTNPQLKLGSCCNPIPGDEILGYVTKGNGIVVHNLCCKNINSFQKERLIPLAWATNIDRKYPVSIKIEATANMNLLVEIMNTVSASGMSILAINANQNVNLEAIVKLQVMTDNLLSLEKMIVNLKKIKYIYNIERDNH